MGQALINKDFPSFRELLDYLQLELREARERGMILESAYIDRLTSQNRYNLRAVFRK